MGAGMNRFQAVLNGERLWVPEGAEGLHQAMQSRGIRTGAVFPTSGSSGAPKYVQLGLTAMKCSALSINQALAVTEDDVFLRALPDFHVGGFMVGFRAALAGASLVEYEGNWDPRELVKLIEESATSISSLVPTQLVDLVKAELACPPSLRAVVIGGARLEESIANAARALGWPVLASFGMSEASSQVATQLPDSGEQMRVLDHWQLSTDPEDRLILRGPALFDGYWRRAESEWQFDPREGDSWCSSDRVELVDGGLRPIGRADRIVKILGEQVDLDWLESRVKAFADPSVRDQLILIALPDLRRGCQLCLVGDCFAGELESLRQSANSNFDSLHQIGCSYPLSPLPTSSLGKPMRGEILRQVLSGLEA